MVVHRLQFAKIRLCFTKSKTLKISSGKKGRLKKGKGDWGFKKGDQRGGRGREGKRAYPSRKLCFLSNLYQRW